MCIRDRDITEATPGGATTLTSLTVDWGDGTAATTAAGTGAVTHTYAAPGTFSVMVTLTNSASQTATKTGNVNVTTTVVVLPPGPPDLFFSEYVEGSSNNKAIELFNGTGAAVDLTAGGYQLQLYFNGSTTATTIALTGTVASQTASSASGSAVFRAP